MAPFYRYLAVASIVITSTLSLGAELRGKVLNGTTGRPAVNDEVVLVTLAEHGMNEGSRTTTDSAGRFHISVDDTHSTQLIRVIHNGVPYHKALNPEMKPLSVEVYDVASKLEGVIAVMDVQRFEATNEMLEVKELVTIRNKSTPPRTLMNDRSFEIQLPVDAEVESGMVQIENDRPLKQKPTRGEQKGQYYFSSPIRPGDTRFAVIYRIPYRGEALIEPKVRNAQERFVVMLPQSMKFEPTAADVYHPERGISPDNVQGTTPVSADQSLAFRISGKGALEELMRQRQENQQSQAEKKPGPGGGLGPPIDAPDPLHEQRWLIAGGLIVTLGCGVVYSTRRASLATQKQSTCEITETPISDRWRGRQKQRRSLILTSGPRRNPPNL